MAELLSIAYFVVGLFVSGAFIGEMHDEEGRKADFGLTVFMFVFGTVFWPAALGMRFGRKYLP